jgi:NAD(P)-dependent dehydrogenase (short-subunit alcohol dehydrogenase family)
LASLQSVRDGAAKINNLVDRIDILINNAAVVVVERQFTKEGIEMQFGTTYIGPFLLTNLLMSKILAAAQKAPIKGSTRIINLTSAGHVISPIRFSDHNFQKPLEDLPEEERPPKHTGVYGFAPGETYLPFVAYGQSKTANVLFAYYLNQQLGAQGIRSLATHPGTIWTELSRNLDEKHLGMIKNTSTFWKDLDQGSSTTLVAALDPKLGESNEVIYLSDCQAEQPAPHANDRVAAERLWTLSEQLVGQTFELRAGSQL